MCSLLFENIAFGEVSHALSYSSVGRRDASCLIWIFKIQTVPSLFS